LPIAGEGFFCPGTKKTSKTLKITHFAQIFPSQPLARLKQKVEARRKAWKCI
jgi:hypothetical protein